MRDKGGQVALQMRAGGEEVGDDDDPVDAPDDQQIGSLFQAGTAEFQEGGFHNRTVASPCQLPGCRPDALVGRLDSRTVGEDDDSSGHALLMYCRMWWISSVF